MEKKRKSIRDGITSFYIRKMKKWMSCPSCEMNLNGRLVISKDGKIWMCDKCGYSLLNSEFEDDYVFWFCDKCGSYLNNQHGFDRYNHQFVCTRCGFYNTLGEDDIVGICKDCGELIDDPDGEICLGCKSKRIEIRNRRTENAIAIMNIVSREMNNLAQKLNSDSDALSNDSESGYGETKETFEFNYEFDVESEDNNKPSVLERLASGEFDMHYNTQEYKGHGKNTYYHYEYDIQGGNIVRRKIVRHKHFDGKESEWEEAVISKEEYKSDEEKLEFIKKHPYWFDMEEKKD